MARANLARAYIVLLRAVMDKYAVPVQVGDERRPRRVGLVGRRRTGQRPALHGDWG